MSNLPIPEGLEQTSNNELANQLHSLAIELLRDARKSDLTTGLTPERLSILSILVYVGSKTVNELAELEQVSAPAITRIVKSLEKDGYVIKAKSRDDKRVVFVSPTRKSKSVLENARKERIERIAKKTEQLSEEMTQQFLSLLKDWK